MSMTLSLFVVRCAALRPRGSARTVPAKTALIPQPVRRTLPTGHQLSAGPRTTVRSFGRGPRLTRRKLERDRSDAVRSGSNATRGSRQPFALAPLGGDRERVRGRFY